MTDKKPVATFEETLSELEAIVTEMESGDLPLQVALEKFERGVTLSRLGQQTLEQAEQKVKILLNDANGETLTDFADREE